MRKRVVIFDLGKVFLKFIPIHENPLFLGKCKAPPEAVKAFFRGPVFYSYECGRMSTAEFVRIAIRTVGYSDTEYVFERDVCDSLELDRDMYDFFDAFKVKHACEEVEFWMLSNLSELHRDFVSRHWPGIFSQFRHVFLSCEMGFRKPDQECFRMMLKQGYAKPHECLFIDDIAENCAAAEKAGIASVQFVGLPELRTALDRYGFHAAIAAGPAS